MERDGIRVVEFEQRYWISRFIRLLSSNHDQDFGSSGMPTFHKLVRFDRFGSPFYF